MIAAARQINLMDAARLLPPRRLPLWSVGAVAASLLLLASGLAWTGKQTQIRLRAASDRLESQVPALRQSVDALEANRGTVIAALRRNVEARERLVRSLDGATPSALSSEVASTKGSQWLEALAHTATDGAWITRVRIDATGQLVISGRALHASAIYALLDRWRAEPLLQAREVRLLDIQRAQQGSDLAFSIGAGDGSGTDKPGEPASGRSALRSATAGAAAVIGALPVDAAASGVLSAGLAAAQGQAARTEAVNSSLGKVAPPRAP